MKLEKSTNMTVNQATPHDEPTLVDAGAGVARGAAKAKAVPQPTVRWQRGRHVIAVVLIVLASLLSPLAIVSGWAQGPLKNSEAFAASLGGLARDPQVQGYITDEVVAAISEQVDIDGLVDEVVNGLSDVITRPASRTALNLLRQTAVDGVNSAVRSATASVVTSEAFARAWEESLLVSHSHAVALLSGDPGRCAHHHRRRPRPQAGADHRNGEGPPGGAGLRVGVAHPGDRQDRCDRDV